MQWNEQKLEQCAVKHVFYQDSNTQIHFIVNKVLTSKMIDNFEP